jgi:pyruvate,water dikinase
MEAHWQWRMRMARQIASELDPKKFGAVAIYVFGSTKNATAAEASDLDILIHFRGSEAQERELSRWLAEWSRRLAELNYQRTGHASDGLLDVHLVTDADIQKKTSYAVKIGASTDAALSLPMGKAS